MPALSIYPDKLSLTIPVPKSLEKDVHSKLKDLSKMTNFTRSIGYWCRYLNLNKYKFRYERNYQIHHEPLEANYFSSTTKRGNFSFQISIYPIDRESRKRKGREQQNFMRLEFNPNEALYSGTGRIYEFLEWLIGNDAAKDIYRKGKVTRIDMCVDSFKNHRTFFPYISGVRETDSKRLSNGSVNVIFGTGNSLFRFTYYDKYHENVSKKKATLFFFHHRFEVRWKNLGISLADLNPTLLQEKLMLGEFFSSTLLNNEIFSEKFKKDVQHAGMNYALSQLEVPIRKRYLWILRKTYKVESVFNIEGKDMDVFLHVLEPFKN